jgi:hypothetical protein
VEDELNIVGGCQLAVVREYKIFIMQGYLRSGQHALKTEQLRVWMLKVPYAVKGNRKNFQFKT